VRIGRAAWLTDTGRRRARNEDAYVFEPPLFAIADGMGGARAGEVAAGLAAAALKDGRPAVSDEASLEARIAEANRQVWERSVADPQTAGMGTTVTVAFVDAPAARILFGHVGDSRAYRLRGDELEQVTFAIIVAESDHGTVQSEHDTIERQRGFDLGEDRVAHPLIGRGRGRAARELSVAKQRAAEGSGPSQSNNEGCA
jgi:serine/threonine protein phosphatase PrpC